MFERAGEQEDSREDEGERAQKSVMVRSVCRPDRKLEREGETGWDQVAGTGFCIFLVVVHAHCFLNKHLGA